MKGLVLTHRRPRRNSGETNRRVGVSAWEKRIGGSAYRRGRSVSASRRSAKIEAAKCAVEPCNAGRAGAQPYRVTHAGTPMRSSLADTPACRYADTFRPTVPQMNPPLRNLRDLAAVC